MIKLNPIKTRIMKTKFIVALFIGMSAIGFSQKQAIRSASKALRSGDLNTATEALNAAEAQLGGADDKMKSAAEQVATGKTGRDESTRTVPQRAGGR